MKTIIDIIKARRSVRVYDRTKKISQKIIEKIIEAGIWAPSGCNEQPWHFTVIENRELIDHISEVAKKKMAESKTGWIRKLGSDPGFHLFYEAPVVIVVSGKTRAYNPLVDCSAATENMMLAATSLGLGTCWIGLISYFFEARREVSRLKIPRGYRPFYAFTLGYPPKNMKFEAPKRNYDVVTYLR